MVPIKVKNNDKAGYALEEASLIISGLKLSMNIRNLIMETGAQNARLDFSDVLLGSMECCVYSVLKSEQLMGGGLGQAL